MMKLVILLFIGLELGFKSLQSLVFQLIKHLLGSLSRGLLGPGVFGENLLLVL